MPVIQNFVSDIETLSSQYTKYTVSRVIANKSDDLLDMEVPADFPSNILQTNIEISLYSLADNSLIFSGTVRNINGALFSETLQYTDGTKRNFLYIDFTKFTDLKLPIGQYSATLNFFVDEIGSYDDRVLKVERISTSRNEVQLKLMSSSLQTKMQSFAEPQISNQYINDALLQIFNQAGSNDVSIPASDVKITTSSVLEYLDSGSALVNLNFTETSPDGKIGINPLTQQILNEAYILTYNRVNQDINSGTSSFSSTRLYGYVTTSLKSVYDGILSDESLNPQKYRFDLI